VVNTARFGLYKETLNDGGKRLTPVKGEQVTKELGIQGVNRKT